MTEANDILLEPTTALDPGDVGSDVSTWIKAFPVDYRPYEALYRHIHSNPELSHQESGTSSLIINHLRGLSPDLELRTGIGGYGLIAILENGPGRTILLRADMDALPVKEETGLSYASRKRASNVTGEIKDVMHACGHDFHIVCLLAAASFLVTARSTWSGVIVFLFQPAEEAGDGAKSMVADGLYDPKRFNCPIPDFVLGQHVAPLPAGTMSVKKGTAMSSSDNYRITIPGSGGHASMPHMCIDPIVIAAHIIVRLQTIVSREVPPDETVVITVGSLHAGQAENVISDNAIFTINIRAQSEEWRMKTIEAVKRVVRAECQAGRCPQEPSIKQLSSIPLTVNDPDVTAVVTRAFSDHFGTRLLSNVPNALGSEDFSILASAVNRPYCFWFWGGVDTKAIAAKEGLAVNHSPRFAPVIQPTLTTGTETLVVLALTILSK